MENNNQSLQGQQKPLMPPPAPPSAGVVAKPPKPAAPPAPPQPPAAKKAPEPSPEEVARKAREMKTAGIALGALLLVGLGFASYIKLHPRTAPAAPKFKEAVAVDARTGQQEPDLNLLLSSVTAMVPGMATAPFLAQGDQGAAARQTMTEASGDILHVLDKYKNRPVAQQFWGDVMAQPEFKAIQSSGTGPDPMAMMAKMQSSPALAGVMTKYMKNPDFVQLVKDVSADPDFKNAITKVNSASGFNQGTLPGVLPPAQQVAAPVPQFADGTMQVNMNELSASQSSAAQSRPVQAPPQLGGK